MPITRSVRRRHEAPILAAYLLSSAVAVGGDWDSLDVPEVHLAPATTTESPPPEVLAGAMLIRVDADGGTRMKKGEGWGDAVELGKIESWLGVFANRVSRADDEPRDEHGLSTRHLVIWSDDAAPAAAVGAVMALCTKPAIRIVNIWLAARAADGAVGLLPLPLPVDPGILPGSGDLREEIELKIQRTRDLVALRSDDDALDAWRAGERDDAECTITLGSLRVADDTALRAALSDLRKQVERGVDGNDASSLWVSIDPGPSCVHYDLVSAVDALRSAGIRHIAVQSPDASQRGGGRPPQTNRNSGPLLGVGGGAGGRFSGPFARVQGRSAQAIAAREAVDAGLDWLARHQSDEGFWSSATFTHQCEGEPCRGTGSEPLDIGVTGLALLAFTGSGNSANAGSYKQNVRRAVKYLMDIQDEATGCFGEPNSHTTFLYDHAIAANAMIEVYGSSKWPVLKQPAERGIAFILAARNQTKAWRYAYPPNGTNDMSVSGWMAMALFMARDCGLEVDEAAFDGVRAFISEMTDEVSGRTGYTERGGGSSRTPDTVKRWPETKTEAMTALALACRLRLGESPDDELVQRGAKLLLEQPPRWNTDDGTIDFTYWYFGTIASAGIGGAHWQEWAEHVDDAVLSAQSTAGDERGSWDPSVDPWGVRGGRVYATALMTRCVNAYGRNVK